MPLFEPTKEGIESCIRSIERTKENIAKCEMKLFEEKQGLAFYERWLKELIENKPKEG